MLENTLESPLDFKEIQPVHPREISPECSLEGLIDVEAESPILRPPNAKNCLI